MVNSTIKNKEKKCKGTGNAKGFGCNATRYIHRYGLCTDCFRTFLFSSGYGALILSKTLKTAKSKIAKAKKTKQNKEKKDNKNIQTLKKELQPRVNAIARFIDAGKGCISCNHGKSGVFTRRSHGGHYYSVGGHDSIRFNLYNIHLQCVQCNMYLSSNDKKYTGGLIERYGEVFFEQNIKNLKQIKSINLTKYELRKKIIIARKILAGLKTGIDITRAEANEKLGIYK